jgi:predicted transposase YbfD/YdcC
MLAVVGHQLGMTLAQLPMERTMGELTGARPLLQTLILKGIVVTMDAQFTQADIAATIVERGGDYLMRVKENQPDLLAEIQRLLGPLNYDPEARNWCYQHETGHGRVEERQMVVHTIADGELDWPGAKQVFVMISKRDNRRGASTEMWSPTLTYGVTSLSAEKAGPEALAKLFREHWTVENSGFWVRDVVFAEDASSVATGNIVARMACLRGAGMSLNSASGFRSVAGRLRELNADRTAAMRMLGYV